MTAYERLSGGPFASRSEVIAAHGMAATSHPLATQIAVEILKEGGTAVDAAIAANAALGLMEPTGSGIGGDLFAIVWDPKSRKLHGLNASGRSPRSLTLEDFRKKGLEKIPARGPLPISVPGAVDGWYELHGRFGNLPMKRLLAPAIRYAREGFAVTEVIAHYWEKGAEILHEQPGFKETFMPGGRAPAKGEIFRNPALASTYEKIAGGGRDAFYKGELARKMAAFVQKHGGFLSYEDLASHRSEWVEPVSTDYRGHTLWELPPNGQGIAALQLMNILEAFDVGAMGFGSAEYLHYFIEAKKIVYEDRARLYADPDFAEVPVSRLVSKEYAASARTKIDPGASALKQEPGIHPPEIGDTIYLATADRNGMMVSLIQSNYRGMGSGLSPDGMGFIFQDRGELFDLEEGRPNSYAPGKRPFHTIIPAFVTREGEPYMAFGVMGGAFQPQGHAQILINLIDFGMNLQEAGDAPRFRHMGSSQPTGERMTDGGQVVVEKGIPEETVKTLKARGHRIEYASGFYGGYQAILRDKERGVYVGASESRKDGHAAGY